MKKLLLVRLFHFGILFFWALSNGFAQQVIDLNQNTPDLSARRGGEFERIPSDYLKLAEKIRPFNINPLLQQQNSLKLKNRITLSLFEDKVYEAILDRVNIDVNGTLTLTASLQNYPTGFALISTSADNQTLVTVDIPELGEKYTTKNTANRESYLLQLGATSEQEAVCHGAVVYEEPEALSLPGERVASPNRQMACTTPTFGSNTGTSANIRLLVVYTEAAETSVGGSSNMNTLIANGIATTNLVWANSEGNATIELAHSERVTYTDSDNLSTDLGRLQSQNDGFVDHIHQLRRTRNADLVALIVRPNPNGTAGIAYLLNADSGASQLGFSVYMANTFNSYTLAHEIGHNMGFEHDAANAGDGTALRPYAYGWRWTGNDNIQYRSVMAYAPGIRVPYYSDPTQTYQGVPTGNAATANNARLFREVKHIIADYKSKVAGSVPAPGNLQVGSTNDHGGTFSWNPVSGAVSYRLYFESNLGWVFYSINGTAISFSLPSYLSAGTTYRWHVSSLSECEVETPSVSSTFTTTGALPVSLALFTASLAERNVYLSWQTTSELNASFFGIERSIDGKDWQNLGRVDAKGNSILVRQYDYSDPQPVTDMVNYYRLKMVDIDGTFSYSAIESIRFDRQSAEKLILYPNPVSDRIYLNTGKTENIRELKLYNVSGKEAKSKLNKNTQTVDVGHLPTGIYLLRIRTESGRSETCEVLIKR